MENDAPVSDIKSHRYFGIEFNNRVWEYLTRNQLSLSEEEEMINLAHGSLLHWSLCKEKTQAQMQRGEYMIAKAYIKAEDGSSALKHARRCYDLTQSFPDAMKDFDFAYAHEIMARVFALLGDDTLSREAYENATVAGASIAGSKDKAIFQADLAKGPWFGLEQLELQ